MKVHYLVLALLVALIGTAKGIAADLTKIDRTIHKEPVYQSKPKYCLLAFGPEAKTRVWLALDGNVLYVDRSGKGDLTGESKCVKGESEQRNMTIFKIGDIVLPDGKTKYTQVEVSKGRIIGRDVIVVWLSAEGERIPAKGGRRAYQAGGFEFQFSNQPKDAPIIHFGGPWTMSLIREDGMPGIDSEGFAPGKETELRAIIGTPGLGANMFAAIGFASVPAQVHPVALIEFPGPDAKGKPLQIKTVLSKRCCGQVFHGPVRVPKEIGKGNAKVTLLFPDWKEGKVAPATFEVPIGKNK